MTRISRSFDVVETPTGRELRVAVSGLDVLRSPAINRGTAFTQAERELLDIDGFLPPHESTLDEQLGRAIAEFSRLPTPLVKNQFLRALQDRNETLFYALLSRHVEEMLPIVYTPTVGEAIQAYSRLFKTPRGLTFSPHNIARVDSILASFPRDDVRMIVATDSSAILGIGDQGYGGIGIAIGKLALYALGGLAPYQTLPASFDVGTNRAALLDDPLYLGLRHHRLVGDAYFALTDAFVAAVKKRYPRAIVQWEDLSKDTAFDVLARYRDVLPSFNDDVQGTGAVALAGLLTAARVRGTRIEEDVYVIHGAGAGGAGVASAILEGLVDAGLTREAAKARVFVLDSKGLLTYGAHGRALEPYKQALAHPTSVHAAWEVAGDTPTLHETIRGARATVLLGLSGQAGAFDEAAVRAVGENAARPVVFPLSNPTTSCEALPADIYRWLGGRAVVCTGSPFAPVTLPDGEVRPVGQGNNAFIFPGLGMGATLTGARKITDGMVLAAAHALDAYTTQFHLASGRTYPPASELLAVSLFVAARVAKAALDAGVAERDDLPRDLDQLHALVSEAAYRPEYLPLTRG